MEAWSLDLAIGPGLEAEQMTNLLIRKAGGNSGSSNGFGCRGILCSSSDLLTSVLRLSLGRFLNSSSSLDELVSD